MVLDPIIDGYHLTRVRIDGGSSLNLIYQDTVRRMGIDPSRINQSRTTFKGVIPGDGDITIGMTRPGGDRLYLQIFLKPKTQIEMAVQLRAQSPEAT